jgi:hypothetical protein
MDIEQPEAPTGINDAHSQPGVVTDGELHRFQAGLESGLSAELFERLSRFEPPDAAPDEPTDAYRDRAAEYVEACIQYRDEIRPDGLRKLEDLPDEINRTTIGNWVRFTQEVEIEHDASSDVARIQQPGKYLFFAPGGVSELEAIILEEFDTGRFNHAKVPTKPGKREDWVLCLYSGDDRYYTGLRDRYDDPPTVKFRGFKSNEATGKGNYSKRFAESSTSE